jgi:protein TonB
MLGWIATSSALALHAGLVALLATGALEHAPRAAKAARVPVTRMVEIDMTPPPRPPTAPEEPPAPPPLPPPAAAPAKPVVKAPKPKPREPAKPEPPPPAPAQAGRLLSAPDEVVDFGDTIVSGTGSHYVGGVSAANGTAQQAARDASANGVVGGVPGGTGDPIVDRARPPRLGGQALWDCPFPPEADDAGIDHAVVTLRVDVAADGGVVRAGASSDPGHGFGREAERCAQTKTWVPALDRSGRAIGGSAIVRVRFDR